MSINPMFRTPDHDAGETNSAKQQNKTLNNIVSPKSYVQTSQ